MSRKRFEGESSNEAQGVGGHDDMHVAALPGELAGEISSFVSCDRTRNSQYDVFTHWAGFISKFGRLNAAGAHSLGFDNCQHSSQIFLD